MGCIARNQINDHLDDFVSRSVSGQYIRTCVFILNINTDKYNRLYYLFNAALYTTAGQHTIIRAR